MCIARIASQICSVYGVFLQVACQLLYSISVLDENCG